ncbi:MAG: hypothetical protein OXC80_01975 [Gammaproteobacteria bacterium]|nr:hypothetical protein [Gammaproteobacteria bacterium]
MNSETDIMEPFDTLEFARKLETAGCERILAEEIAIQVKEAMLRTVATKADLKLAIGNLTAEIRTDMSKQTIQHISWTFGMFVAFTGLLFAAFSYFG